MLSRCGRFLPLLALVPLLASSPGQDSYKVGQGPVAEAGPVGLGR